MKDALSLANPGTIVLSARKILRTYSLDWKFPAMSEVETYHLCQKATPGRSFYAWSVCDYDDSCVVCLCAVDVSYAKDLFLHIGVKYINQKAKGDIDDQKFMETFVRVFAKF